MKEFEFTLKFSLSDDSINPDDYIERLAEHGCDDALIGIGQNGRIALQFNRQAENALEAVFSAIENIKAAIPDAKLIEATPDLVGLTDVAEVLGFSRQNIRKLMLNNKATFPAPVHEGKSALWHLSTVLNWLEQAGRYSIDESLLDIAKVNMQLNIAKEARVLESSVQSRFYSVGV